MKITINDVAKLANVSKATVSAVVNGKDTVSNATRNKVLEIIDKLDYRPDEIARSLSSRKTKSIGLIIKEIDNPYFAKIMKGVYDVSCGSDYTVLLGSSELSPLQEEKIINTLTNQRVAGLIISPLQGSDVDFKYLVDLIKKKFPIVMLGMVKNYSINVVDIDNKKSAYEAVNYLIKLGHTEIAYFGGPAYSAHSQDRFEGYRQALIDNNLRIRDDFVISVGSYIEESYEAGKIFFSASSAIPSAVFCYNDLVAIGLINALLDLNIQVPEQISVIGFDDIDVCKSVRIPLTTVQVPAYEMGREAADLLLKQIENPDQVLTQKVILNAKLIERNSCAKKLGNK